LSVAFTKEDSAETASEALLPDRPISPHPNLVTEAGLKALEFQLQQTREAYETAQKIEDVNERRRQAVSNTFGSCWSSAIRRQNCASSDKRLISVIGNLRRSDARLTAILVD
jgi:hypothetical protein